MITMIRSVVKLFRVEPHVRRIRLLVTTKANETKYLHPSSVIGGTFRTKEIGQRIVETSSSTLITFWNGERRLTSSLHFKVMLIEEKFVEEFVDERSVCDAVREIWFCCELHLTFGTLRKTFSLFVHPPSLFRWRGSFFLSFFSFPLSSCGWRRCFDRQKE